MLSHQSSKDKPRAAKCNHFCHPFDNHNYRPTCREAGKGDDPCVTLLSPCTICSSFTEEQLAKITHRKRYSKKSDKLVLNLFHSRLYHYELLLVLSRLHQVWLYNKKYKLILRNLCLLALTYKWIRKIFVKIFRNLYTSKERWIRPLLLLPKRMHPPKI